MTDLHRLTITRKEGKEPFHPLNLDQWRFYVLPTTVLNGRKRSQHSITLKTLEGLCSGAVTYADLLKTVENCIKKQSQGDGGS